MRRFWLLSVALLVVCIGLSVPSAAGAVSCTPGPYRNLSGCNFSARNLSNVNLQGSNLAGTDLSGTTLTGANLTKVRSGGVVGVPVNLPWGWEVVGGYLVGPTANLNSADFSGADLTGADLTRANLRSATVTNAILVGANLENATLAGVVSGGVSGSPAALPIGWNIVDGYLLGRSADLVGANLSGATIDSINLSYANLNGADLTNASIFGARLSSTTFDGATLTSLASGDDFGVPSLPAGWTLTKGYMVGPEVKLDGAQLEAANLAGLDLQGASLQGANLAGANLTNANVTGANLTDASAAKMTLSGADLTGASLDGVTSGGITGSPSALPENWQPDTGILDRARNQSQRSAARWRSTLWGRPRRRLSPGHRSLGCRSQRSESLWYHARRQRSLRSQPERG